ncbi:MAG: hypothetical protein KGS44_13205 [Alphaproteobacteria bacterium]|nr:hypothetical protein [Alphaproteobacteria bacterium]
MSRLTKLEKEMLRRSGEFVLAGEWPWDEGDSFTEIRRVKNEMNALRSAIDKIEGAAKKGKP